MVPALSRQPSNALDPVQEQCVKNFVYMAASCPHACGLQCLPTLPPSQMLPALRLDAASDSTEDNAGDAPEAVAADEGAAPTLSAARLARACRRSRLPASQLAECLAAAAEKRAYAATVEGEASAPARKTWPAYPGYLWFVAVWLLIVAALMLVAPRARRKRTRSLV